MKATHTKLRTRIAARAGVLVLVCIGIAGCSGERGTSGGPEVAATPRPAQPPVNMGGRWMLSSVGRQCGMNFGAGGGASEGTIAPEGGCPGRFFTSRKWTFDSSGLVMRNHNGEPLAQLTADASGRFEGRSTSGEPVTLAR